VDTGLIFIKFNISAAHHLNVGELFVAPIMTSLEMQGTSISLLRLSEREWHSLLNGEVFVL
jgi:dihydroxyacetone kinase